MQSTTARDVAALCVALSALVLSACGGGSGAAVTPPSGGVVIVTGTGTPTPPPAKTTQAFGSVVDNASNTPLSGVSVALMPWTPSATPFPVTTTNPQGDFAFTAATGHYILIIGSNSPADTRATVHDNITLQGGVTPQPLIAPTAWPIVTGTQVGSPVVTYTPPPSQLSGNYRLTLLDPNIQAPCVAAVNQNRAALNLPPLVPDEWMEENAYAFNQAQNETNSGNAFSAVTVTMHTDGTNGPASCANWMTDYPFNPGAFAVWSLYPMATAIGTIWYGGAFSAENSSQKQPGSTGGFEEWGYDPRIDSPCPAPTPNPLPTPGPGACDPSYQPWP